MGFGNNASGKFEPKQGQGTLFVKGQKKLATSPDYDGYFIADRPIAVGEKIKLVGWDKSTANGAMITLKIGRDQQEMPQANQGAYVDHRGAPQQAPAPQVVYGQRVPYNTQGGQQAQNYPRQGINQQYPPQGMNQPAWQHPDKSSRPLQQPQQRGYGPDSGAMPPDRGAPPPVDDLPF